VATDGRAEGLAALKALTERINNPKAAREIREKATMPDTKPSDAEKFEAIIRDNPAFTDLQLVVLPE
jgi:hypothetical protein